ncbi:MAG: Nif3-like dinuclear metal center hexameric protein [Treponema sp.]|jgi:dinuclear metal center YbgI/SA1388 family protein|nr:Nif3-like dinuclear metal center hexameric protein [Treponema sp.]
MTTKAFDTFFRDLLDIERFQNFDSSLNGLQVDNDGADVNIVAFAVDASLETFKRALSVGAGMLFVHHGLLWGKRERFTGLLRERLAFLIKHNIALYAVHLPLDQNPTLGNNAVLARLLNVDSPKPFGWYHGVQIGYTGRLSSELTVDEAVQRISYLNRPPLNVYPFGVQKNRTVAIISGGAAFEAQQALEEAVDLYITGEMNHAVYHMVLEGKLNMIAGGHYNTETWGVRAVMDSCVQLPIRTEFIDVPTGL